MVSKKKENLFFPLSTLRNRNKQKMQDGGLSRYNQELMLEVTFLELSKKINFRVPSGTKIFVVF